ncbi:MAG TPA: copper chaperone CopZ [Bacilli bacterium]|nr:copper chaperone CopZ [Bacilli bacterium]
MEHITLRVEGMSCGHCKGAVEGALKEVGVDNATVNLEAGTVDVSYDSARVTVEKMREAIEEAGYDVA